MELKNNISTIADDLGISVEELAIRSGIDPAHLQQVVDGETELMAEDLFLIIKYTKLPVDRVVTTVEE